MKKPTEPQVLPGTEFGALPEGFPRDLVVASRLIYTSNPEGDRQYLVYRKGFGPENDPKFQEVISASFDLNAVGRMAMMRLHQEALPPTTYQPRLEGCSFVRRFEGARTLQVCVDSRGRELGRGETREDAARIALHRALAGAKDLSVAEFGATSCVAGIERTAQGVMFSDQDGQDRIAGMVSRAYEMSASIRQAAKAEARSLGMAGRTEIEQRDKEVAALQFAVVRRILEQAEALGDGLSVKSVWDVEDWHGVLILHGPSLTSTQALALAYERYQAAGFDSAAEDPVPPRATPNERICRQTA